MMDDLTRRITDLEIQIDSLTSEARRLVRELVAPGPGRYLVMERLPRLGSVAAAPARELAGDDAVDSEVRVMASLVALEVGDSSHVDPLLREVERAGELGQLAASRLAAHHVAGADAAILHGLQALAPTRIDEVVGYLQALRKAGGRLPDDVRARIAEPGAWQIVSALDEWFPRV